jgi:TonB family protein
MRRFALILLLLSASSLFADDAAIQSRINSALIGKRFFISGFPSGSKLKFDADGKLAGKFRLGVWTVDGLVQISQVNIRKNRVEITGTRELISFQPGDGKCVINCPPAEPRTTQDSQVFISIDLGGATTTEQAQAVVNRVLLDSSGSIVGAVPAYWKTFVCRMEAANQKIDDSSCWEASQRTKPAENPAKDQMLLATGERVPLNEMKAPHVTIAPDPEYSSVARMHKYQATPVLWVVVNESGAAVRIEVDRPCGMGLDEKAIEAVRQWRFRPALWKGKPVASQILIEVKFRLF